MQNQNSYRVKIGGYAGQGVKSAGLLLAKCASRSGYNIYTYTEFPSIIRGGHNVIQVSISKGEVTSQSSKTNMVIALNKETFDKYAPELENGDGILYDETETVDMKNVKKGVVLYPIPFAQIIAQSGGSDLTRNTVALGVVVALLAGDKNILHTLITDEYKHKGETIVSVNAKAADLGYSYAIKNFTHYVEDILTPIENPPKKMIVNGNEAVALGAIASGLQFAAIYPMSPISSIIDTLSKHQEKYGYVYKQPEDEISAITMAIGASYTGLRSMTATSGGGFCLMTEGLGLAGMTETPLVIVVGMRPGPATGLPTWSEQGDLLFALSAHQGDFPRIVLAPGDARETFYVTAQAFNLAAMYQTPVIVLIDKNICEADVSLPVFDSKKITIDHGKYHHEKITTYKRYALSPDGISQRAYPGQGTYFFANSDEHTEEGYSSEEIIDRTKQVRKRMQKLTTCARNDMQDPKLYGPVDADITLVSWGSNKGVILEVLKHEKNINYLHITWMNPFPTKKVSEILSKARRIIDIECNFTGQLGELLRQKTGINIKERYLKYDGRPFFPEEIISRLHNYDAVK